MKGEISVLYVGDSGIVLGPLIFESPFLMEIKDVYLRDWSRYLTDALRDYPEIKVEHLRTIEAYRDFPRTRDELNRYDVIILSDVTSETLRFYPRFFPIQELVEISIIESEEYVLMPDRLELIKSFVEDGGGLLMAGGWYSFSGRFGHGGWYGTPVAEVLPVEIMRFDDRVEAPMGVRVKVIDREDPVVRGIDWETCPPFLGYNQVRLKSSAKLVAVIGEGDPFIVTGEYGKGRVMAFTSDPVLHWGINFVKWKYYPRFWMQAIKWLAKKL